MTEPSIPRSACTFSYVNTDVFKEFDYLPDSVTIFHYERRWAWTFYPHDFQHVQQLSWTVKRIPLVLRKLAIFKFLEDHPYEEGDPFAQVAALVDRLKKLPPRETAPRGGTLYPSTPFHQRISHLHYFAGRDFSVREFIEAFGPERAVSYFENELKALINTPDSTQPEHWIALINEIIIYSRDVFLMLFLYLHLAREVWTYLQRTQGHQDRTLENREHHQLKWARGRARHDFKLFKKVLLSRVNRETKKGHIIVKYL